MAVLLVRFVLFSAGGSVFLGGRAVFFGIGFRVKQALLLPVFTRSQSTGNASHVPKRRSFQLRAERRRLHELCEVQRFRERFRSSSR
jgi:hypothetical protein